MEHRIDHLLLLPPEVGEDEEYYYAEGHSPLMFIADLETRIGRTNPSTWFVIEDDWKTICEILSKDLGFTATQILEARDRSKIAGAFAFLREG